MLETSRKLLADRQENETPGTCVGFLPPEAASLLGSEIGPVPVVPETTTRNPGSDIIGRAG